MKRLFSIIIITALLSISLIANAGRVVLFTTQTDSSVTMFGSATLSPSGISVVMVQDQTQFPASFDGIYSLGFPPTIIYADTANADAAGGTGNAETAGSGVSYYYITINQKDAPSNATIEALGTSGVTPIVQNVRLDSSTTAYVTFPFTPELGKWLFIVAAGNTNFQKPGVEIAIQ